MAEKDQLNKKIHSGDQSINSLTGDTLSKFNPLTNGKNHIDKWSNFESAELDTKGVRRNVKHKNDLFQQNLFKRKSASLPNNSYPEPKCTDRNFTDGYSLFVKYRHVYAGTGNWFKRAPYKHAYPPRGSSSISSSGPRTEQDAKNKKLLHRREVMRKLANSLQLTKPKESKIEQKDFLHSASNRIALNISPQETEKEKNPEGKPNQPEVNEWNNPENDSRQISLDLLNNHQGNHGLISQSKYNRKNTEKSDTSLLKNRNETISKDLLDFEPKRTIENLIDSAGHEEDASFTRCHIDKCCTSVKMKPSDKLKNQSVATEFSRVDKYTLGSEQTVKANIQIKESSRRQGLEPVNYDVSTRTGMKMFSRLSLEARTAMDEAKKEILNRINLDENVTDKTNSEKDTDVSPACSNRSNNVEEIRTDVSCEPQSSSDTKEHTEECAQVTNITEGKIECCCPYEKRKHFITAVKKQARTFEKERHRKEPHNSNKLIRSVSVDRSLPKKQKPMLQKCETRTELHEDRKEGDSKDYLRTLTKNDKHICNNGFPPQKVVPLSMVGREGTFQITPAGYDSRFSDRQAVLDEEDENETLKEIRNIAIQKCNDWLLNHTQ